MHDQKMTKLARGLLTNQKMNEMSFLKNKAKKKKSVGKYETVLNRMQGSI